MKKKMHTDILKELWEVPKKNWSSNSCKISRKERRKLSYESNGPLICDITRSYLHADSNE